MKYRTKNKVEQEEVNKHLDDLFYCASKFEDKPHLIFNWIRRFALLFGDEQENTEEVQKLMNVAYCAIGSTNILKKMKKKKYRKHYILYCEEQVETILKTLTIKREKSKIET